MLVCQRVTTLKSSVSAFSTIFLYQSFTIILGCIDSSLNLLLDRTYHETKRGYLQHISALHLVTQETHHPQFSKSLLSNITSSHNILVCSTLFLLPASVSQAAEFRSTYPPSQLADAVAVARILTYNKYVEQTVHVHSHTSFLRLEGSKHIVIPNLKWISHWKNAEKNIDSANLVG